MIKINIKPLSVNNAWQGRRFKTDNYKQYEEELFLLLPKVKIPKGKLKLNIIISFKNKLSDIDNPIKPFLDILQKAYEFNDRDIYELNIKKIVGDEYIKFSIQKL